MSKRLLTLKIQVYLPVTGTTKSSIQNLITTAKTGLFMIFLKKCFSSLDKGTFLYNEEKARYITFKNL